MFLGDGMSVPTLAAARTLLGQREGRTGEEAQLSFEGFPTLGLAKTYCVDQQIPDSACTATAYLCGVKNNYGTIGVTGEVQRRDCTASLDESRHVASIAEWALQDGRDVGIVTTTRITHASPAGAYAKVADRRWENDARVAEDGHDPLICRDIAHQLVHMYPGNQFKVILGGGRREFRPNTTRDEENTRGSRTDGRNLIDEWMQVRESQNVSYEYVWNREQLFNLTEPLPEYLLGLFEGSHMQYHMEANVTMEPTLTELTEIAIRSLSRNEKGFFLFVESGRIDHAHHGNFAHLALDETIQMHFAVQRATELLSEEDTLIVVTADHAHVMTINGYTNRGGSIIGRSGQRGNDGIHYMTLSYANGPGARPHVDGARVDVTQDTDFGDLRWRSHAEVPQDEETHGGDDVAVFALGPHHEMFTGLYEQSRIPHLMAYAACIGPGLHYCNDTAT
ncbi:membrane-bound alkaline phosphatase-like [Aphomia sociella]